MPTCWICGGPVDVRQNASPDDVECRWCRDARGDQSALDYIHRVVGAGSTELIGHRVEATLDAWRKLRERAP